MGVFDKWFGNFFKRVKLRYAHSFGSRSISFDRDAYEQETVRAIIDCIASHTAKAEALHVIVDDNGRIKEIKRDSPYAKLLNQRPNEIMCGYDLKYKLVTQVENYTTAMLYIDWDGEQPRALYPVNYRQHEFLQMEDGNWEVRFTDSTGDLYSLPLEYVVVLRKFYNTLDVGGDGNGPVYSTLDMIKTAEQGMADALQVSNKIRGLLKQKAARLDDDDVQDPAKVFAENMRKAAETGGVVGIDATADYVPITTSAYSLNAAQMKDIRDGLYRYWRISESILKSDYTESQWQAFYESVIEPRLIQMGQAFSNACFTDWERDQGHRIIFFSSALMHASIQTKVMLVQESKETALFTVNEQRELFGYPPVEGGDKRQVSLNYVNADNQDAYQGVGAGKEDTSGQGKDADPADQGE